MRDTGCGVGPLSAAPPPYHQHRHQHRQNQHDQPDAGGHIGGVRVHATPVDVKGGRAEASTTAVAAHATPALTVAGGDVLVSGFTTDKAATWTASDHELADAATGNVSAAMYYSTPVTAGSQSRTGTATTSSVKAVSAILALNAG